MSSLAAGLFFSSCKGKEEKKPDKPVASKKEDKKKDSQEKPADIPAKRPPVINITDTVAQRFTILYVKDSAVTSDRISEKLANIYGFKLPEFILKNKLRITGRPVAWYKAQQSPFFFEAGLPIDKKPAKLPKGFFIKTIGGDSAVVAHFYGPYDLTPTAYEALNSYFKSHKRKRTAPPYEIYVGELFDKKGKKIDPYKVQTDIIFPYR
ncbi:AraC family transcriptional regulator [Ferruginibacter sp. HRS2-29]|nr:AraC family transcriptional regulator [Ferruginibacter sp. HRS2-29]